jgi:hypothetical protein
MKMVLVPFLGTFPFQLDQERHFQTSSAAKDLAI